ncbi:MAG: C45 family autoproteolytic acyltransferase/hydrolase, partial [Planctomycetota bacterium]
MGRPMHALLAIVVLAGAVAPVLAETTTTDHGELFTVDGAQVLKLWGTPRERGRAHGTLLGRKVMAIVNSFLVGSRASKYEEKLAPMVPVLFSWPRHIEEELQGLLEGMEGSLPREALEIKALGRKLTLDDLKAFNSLGDWQSLACSTLTAWGQYTEGGRTLVGRNFDYFLPPVALRNQLLVVHCPSGARKAFVTVSFPGNLGAITFMNSKGVFGAIHDVHVLPTERGLGYTPRLVTLRLAAETAGGPRALEEALALCRKHRSLYGNNFHFAFPSRAGGKHPAAVIEYDSDRSRENGATLRTAPDRDRNRLWNTNHYRLRAEATKCRRFSRLDTRFGELSASGKRIDVEAMKALMKSAVQPSTMHQVV